MTRLFAIMLIVAGCGLSQEEMEQNELQNYIPVRPFVIHDKYMHHTTGNCTYCYYDRNGKKLDFEDYCTKYSIGDTIK